MSARAAAPATLAIQPGPLAHCPLLSMLHLPPPPLRLPLPAGRSLHDAQLAKLDELISKAGIGPGDSVLEIGCGWGGLAIRAAQTKGCRRGRWPLVPRPWTACHTLCDARCML